jgi:hypothetical protein
MLLFETLSLSIYIYIYTHTKNRLGTFFGFNIKIFCFKLNLRGSDEGV